MTTRLVFLDIDGVLNRLISWKRQARRKPAHVDPQCLAVLHSILGETGARVVLSSSWRLVRSRMQNVRLLRRLGVQCNFAGCTPHLSMRQRGDEIAAFLRKTRPADFVIIDDDRDMRYLRGRLVKTRFKSGLLPKHLHEAKRRLGA